MRVLALFSVIGALVLGAPAHVVAQDGELEDVVYLKDGSIIRGVIIEQIPGESVLIRTRDGNQFRYQMDEITRIAKEARHTATPSEEPQQLRPGGKSGGTALLWSLLLTGGGQFYNGDYGLGTGLLLTGIISAPFWIDATVTCYDIGDQCGVSLGLGVLFFGSKIFSIIEAPAGSRRWNRRNGYAVDLTPRPDIRVLRVANGPTEIRVGASFARIAF